MIVGFTGKMHCGKDTASDLLIAEHEFNSGRFAGALKAMLWAFYEYAGVPEGIIHSKLYGNLREVPCDLLGGKTPRFAMQTLGTDWGREMLFGSIWVNTELTRTRNSFRTVFTDVRFDNEAECIRDAGGLVVLIDRPEAEDTDASDHTSEDGISSELINYTLKNDGTLKQFKESVRKWFAAIESD